ncbi:hypothetical protein ACFE6N_02745 [Pedobacter sp. BG31]|uniref:hypothetical protein n=1 Tax=Pedobacter sp. BG31 TaxID=3349697 RepID=UPI0035F3FDD7
MRTYCLTYDAVDSDKYKKDPNYFRRLIVKTLLENDCENFHMPVSSTIIFDYPFSLLDNLNLKFRIGVGAQIYYNLCLVSTNGNRSFIVGNPDNKLSQEFDEFVKSL